MRKRLFALAIALMIIGGALAYTATAYTQTPTIILRLVDHKFPTLNLELDEFGNYKLNQGPGTTPVMGNVKVKRVGDRIKFIDVFIFNNGTSYVLEVDGNGRDMTGTATLTRRVQDREFVTKITYKTKDGPASKN
jgi:hypothetical protein